MKIVSWNVNGIRASGPKGLLDFVETENPDILCLQETKAHIGQVEPRLKDLGFKSAHWSSAVKKGYSGTATFFNRDIKAHSKGIGIPQYDSEGRFVVTEHEHFDLYNIYFPNGGSGDERHLFKQKFLQDLLAHFKSEIKKGKQLVVVGDYNIAHTAIDVHDPVRLSKESGFLPEERAWMDQFFQAGFVDSFRLFHPNEKERYSWWSYRELARPRNRGWRIDYICVTEGLRAKLKSADILDQVQGSDHCPVIVEFSD
jgi:exodeoxyribonuclease III